MTKVAAFNEIQISPGVMPFTDATPSDVPCWTAALHVRFDPTTGRVRKLGGWNSQNFNYNNMMQGVCRTVYSAIINQKVYTVLGTNSNLYSLIGSELVNISPLEADDIAIADSLDTHYATLANNPITTVDGSNLVVIADTEAELFQQGDIYTLSGATTTNGIPDTELNISHIVRQIAPGEITIYVGTAANADGTGGGNSVVRSSGLMTVNDTANGLTDGMRIKIEGATTTGGIPDTDINAEFIIRNVATDSFDIMTGGTASSSVTGGGGSATVYYPQIEPGPIDGGLGQGYGVGLYGVGLYGTALLSTSGETYPRIWFVDRFGDNIVMTYGNNGAIYTWDGDTTEAPVVLSNAPDDVNYAFVSNNILVTFGHDVENKIFASDQGDYTGWTSSSTNQVFEDTIEGAGRFISHVGVDGYNLIFTEQQTYTMKYIGLPLIWQILPLDPAIGLIAPMARVSVNGIAYWMGQNNFYMFRGGKIEVIPSNITPQSTILRYVFDDLNYSQRFKIFMWYNEQFDEIWLHYPSSDSNEPNRIARLNRRIFAWVPDEMDRTAGEYPTQSLSNPRLANLDTLYVHESGTDDDGLPMAFSATTRKYVSGKDTALLTQVVPDNEVSGNITLQVNTYNYPQSQVPMNNNLYTITPTTEKVPVQLNGRFYDYTVAGEELGQNFLMGQWYEEPQKGATAP